MRRLIALLVAVSALVGVVSRADAAEPHWVAAWATAPQSGGASASNQTFRQFVHTSTGGSELRLRFSNRYGTKPVTLRHVTVARPASSARPRVKQLTAVRFASGDAVTIPVGTEVRSLPVRFAVPSNGWVAVSFHAPGNVATTTQHGLAWGLNWKTRDNTGDHAGDARGDAFVPAVEWTYLTSLEVVAPESVSTVVAFGDSITDALYSAPFTNTRWPDMLNNRLRAEPGPQRFSVVNTAINGNLASGRQVDDNGYGEPGFDRIVWDVLDLPNVSTVIIYLGVNDIGSGVPVPTITAAYERMIHSAKARGIRVLMATVTPVSNGDNAARNRLNRWIVANRGQFDGVLRFDEAVRNPRLPATWRAGLTIGDHTHPNPRGMEAIANSIPLELIR